MKSTGHDLAEACTQALNCVKDLDPEDRPRWLLVSDFARYEAITAPLAPAAQPQRAKKIPAAKPAYYPTQADLDAGHMYFGAKEDPLPAE